ncbi:putative DD41D transposase [Trichonephila clavipes]|nr:putative DD41D transposase [Trichonephila clavipes]
MISRRRESVHTSYCPLLDTQASKEEQRGVVRLLGVEGVGCREMHRRMKAVYGEYSLCHSSVELWFQQDSATCHTAHATIDLLKDTFGDRLISRFGPVNWPPRSWDLTSLDYFLWGYVKSLVYADKPQTLDHLEDNIRRVIADIRPQMLEKVIENWTS